MNTSLMAINATTPHVFVKNSKVITTSQYVASYFGKRHERVLDRIKKLDCSPEFTQHNFVLSEYTDSTGRKLPMYEMTKDGFVFLVMGFTGKKAAQFKEAYIAEFNKMEAALNSTPNNNSPTAVLVHFDKNGHISFSETVPHNSFVSTINGFIEIAKKYGYLIITPEDLINKLVN